MNQQQQQKYSTNASNQKKGKANKRHMSRLLVPTSSTMSVLLQHHRNVKTIPKLQDKSIEEQIIRCIDRMKSYPNAIDTLYRALHKLLQTVNEDHYDDHDNVISTITNDSINKKRNNRNDHNKMKILEKICTIDPTTSVYQRCIANVPGAEALLIALNYRKQSISHLSSSVTMNNNNNNNDNNNNNNTPINYILQLDHTKINPIVIKLALHELDIVKKSSQYMHAKAMIVFNKEINTIITSSTLTGTTNMMILSEGALHQQQQQKEQFKFLSKCPPEPTEGLGSYIQMKLGTENNSPILRRRFYSDDTVDDVFNWLGSIYPQIYTKIVETKEWYLIDLNRNYGTVALPIDYDPANATRYTLQSIGCWPSGKLEIRPKLPLLSTTTTTSSNTIYPLEDHQHHQQQQQQSNITVTNSWNHSRALGVTVSISS